ncbi:MAG: polyprenyl diphosphate synthase [Planctomycetota bacterium]|nr:polyprenyl diphosphate synthase [Planctomycetota bacterium]
MSLSSDSGPSAEERPPAGVRPGHLGFIMDGNGRWAEQRQLPRTQGHAEGAEALRQMLRLARKHHIAEVTCFALSTENFEQRSEEELQFLFDLLAHHLEQEREEMERLQICFRAIGRLQELPRRLIDAIEKAQRETSGHKGLVFRLAVNYGGRAELADAFCSGGAGDPSLIGAQKETALAAHLYDPAMPDLDLLVRTGGEMRLSNFLLWHSSYAELYFTPVLWPDFSAVDFAAALEEYSRRSRRFGSVSTTTSGGDA